MQKDEQATLSVEEALLSLLHIGQNHTDGTEAKLASALCQFSLEQWQTLYTEVVRQGVTAFAWHNYELLCNGMGENQTFGIPNKLKLTWYVLAQRMEATMQKSFDISAHFAKILLENGIRTTVLKGSAFSIYYPNPLWREFGDLDCYLHGAFAEGNQIAQRIGATVEDGGYKHSHISFHGLSIENHQFLTSFDGTQRGKELEHELQKFLTERDTPRPIKGTALQAPNPDFSALFLIRHAQGHFLDEGIMLRHILDWKLFIEHEHQNVDWTSVFQAARRFHMLPFMTILTAFCVNELGLNANLIPLKLEYSQRIYSRFHRDIFASRPSVHNKNLFKKMLRIARRFVRMWCFRQLLNEHYLLRVWNVFAYCSYLHRHPKLSSSQSDSPEA